MAAMQIMNNSKKATDAQIVGLPCLLKGEIVLSSCEKVLKYSTTSKHGSGVMGSLHVTNFKLAFTTTRIGTSGQKPTRRMSQSVKSRDLFLPGALHVDDYFPLTCISGLVAISTSKNKTKVLTSSKTPSSKYNLLEVLCKDFRIIQFDMSLCSSTRRNFLSTLVHYAFPDTIPRLFAFDYCVEKFKDTSENFQRAFYTFRHSKDYELLLTSQSAQKAWHVSRVNAGFSISRSLPELNVFPLELQDEELVMLALFYEDGRLPTWEWSDSKNGVSLLTSGALKPSRSSFYVSSHEKVVGHPELILTALQNTCNGLDSVPEVEVILLTMYFPTIQELQQGFMVLRKTCSCHSGEEYWSSDNVWLSKIEGSRWMEFIQLSFKCTLDVIQLITEQSKPVILEEPLGRDYTCLVSSLVQICLDPFFRTILGLQSLIQKSWVAKGHKFLDRLAHLHCQTSKKIKPVKTEVDSLEADDSLVNVEESPVFLLFVNCLHNLVVQHPTHFEYNENFLFMLLDSIYACLFDTFLFNSEYQRKQTSQTTALESLWDFLSNEMRPSDFDEVFVNPLMKISSLEREFFTMTGKTCNGNMRKNEADLDFNYKTDDLENGCYLRSSDSKESQLFDGLEMNKQYLLPEVPIVHNDFWRGYFLRWLPKFDVGEDADASLSRQQKVMVEELEYLEDRFIRLHTIQDSMGTEDTSSNHSQKSLSWRRKNKASRLKQDLDNISSSTIFTFYSVLHDVLCR